MKKTLCLITSLLLIFGGLIGQTRLEVDGNAKILQLDTILTSSSNVVIQSDGTLAIRKYKVGDCAQGGIIFWVDETGEHGLVVDTADISTDISWFNDSLRTTNAIGDGVFSGEMNTALIIALQTKDNPVGSFAALICSSLTRGDFGDWYLPSKHELSIIYEHRDIINSKAISTGGSAFDTDKFYWSSTEVSDDQAWRRDWTVGSDVTGFKNENSNVRAIRAF